MVNSQTDKRRAFFYCTLNLINNRIGLPLAYSVKCVVRDGSVAASAHADEGHGGGAGPRSDSKRGEQYHINNIII
ncbi:hypothetical protein HF086_012200 [Spodoptera exigua]|uniref:Uncharacterized protein n=1 Tax=Spodoptera exigua TaxID=7107 RepID=A0A922SEH6_SPOEX|nr:hypothetical protein HF086_012200 [Spodoptera exigua]